MATQNLKSVLAQGGPLDPARAVDVVSRVAAAIDAAHASQTVHRDVSTDTIYFAGDGSVFLGDRGGSTPSTERTRSLVTNTEATYRGDVDALAAVLYECLLGHPPQAAGPDVPVRRPSEQRAGLPGAFDDVVAKGLAANPDDRYHSAAELVAAARAALAVGPPAPFSPSEAATRTIDLPPPPPSPNPSPPQWDPGYGRSPTVSYPHSRPIPLPSPPPRRRRRRLAPVLAVVVIVGAVVAGAIAIPRLVHHSGSTPAASTTSTVAPAGPRRTYAGQPIELPFPGMYPTKSLAVDGAGNIYVLASIAPPPDAGMFDSNPAQLFKLTPGGSGPTTLEFPGVDLRSASDLTVDQAGNIYVSVGAQVWFIEAGKSTAIRLPFRGFSSIQAIAVDTAGNVYAVGGLLTGDMALKYGAKKLAPGENRPTDLAFSDIFLPRGMAVDKAGNIYICAGVKGTGHGRILKLAAGATAATALPIPDLIEPRHVAFDSAGNIFIADGFGRGFFEWPVDGGSVVKVPLVANSYDVAFDSTNNLYVLTSAVSDRSDKLVQPGRVLKIPPDG
ncbi:hypothetical protein [Mycobacterium asiaticum]|uniref:Protein kinase domain-containing protein n=1 Tax=Mycobacterium asiaticum TaxID=1790 RepID=A0A1A3NRG2_MYCAS|nr:hypothetical protein [Mycobacterium asiaticum]OBK23960.1 hypothetical protein A5635_18575 [Mycobacterium asiaticum]